MTKWVYTFGDGAAEGRAGDRNLLGGKGANLAEMCSLGLPVPPGFTLTTEVCNAYYANGSTYPSQLKADVAKALDHIGKLTDRRFGDPSKLLLVSVRSGARASMPGMMDTVLNLGLNDETVEALAADSGDARFAYDSYRRFIQMYSDVVMGLDHEVFEEILEDQKASLGHELDTELTAEEWQGVIALYKAKVEEELDKPFPQDPHEQLWGAISAVFSSWMNNRAITYRRLHDIPESWGTAVNVQAMVFGNMGETSATGVAFTRNPSTGEKMLYGEFLVNAQGEDVVAGIRTPQNITEAARIAAGSDKPSLQKLMPDAFRSFVDISDRLEQHYRDMQDLEFTIERGKLWMLQTRSGKRTAKAALKIAVEMARDKLITTEEAVARIDPASLDQLLHPTIDPEGRARCHRRRPAGFSGRGDRRDRLLVRRCRRAEDARPQGDPGAHRNQPRRHSRHACFGRHPDHARRHDQPRRRGGARHGQALRVGRRLAARRLQGRHADVDGPDLPQGRHHHHRRQQRPGAEGRRVDAAAGTVRRFRRHHGMGRRACAA